MKITPNDKNQSIRFASGLTVYDEALYRDRYLARYWSVNGQLLPESQLAEGAFFERAERFPLDSFLLSINGQQLTRFSLLSQGEAPDETTLFSNGPVKVWKTCLQSLDADIRVTVCTRLDGSEFLVRWLEIENGSDAPVGIDSVYPFAGRVWLHDGSSFRHPPLIEHTADAADFDLAYCRNPNWQCEGDFYFSPLQPGVFRFDGGKNGRSGWSRPGFWLRDNRCGQILAVEFAYSGNWEFEIHTAKTEKTSQAGVRIGIPAIDGEFIRVLDKGERVQTPLVHVAMFPHRSLDEITQCFHTHIRNTVMPQPPEGRDIEVEVGRVYNEHEGEVEFRADVDVAHAIGAELYMVDAGWFGNDPNIWPLNTGDWHAGPWFPNGLTALADYIHSKGMKFGLWFEIEAVGMNTKLSKAHPEWQMKRGEEYCVPYYDFYWGPYRLAEGGRALDLSKPEVIDWLEQILCEHFEHSGIDLYRVDHNHDMGLGGNRIRCGLRENVLWTYYENFYRLHHRLRKKYPNIVFQNCAGGGGRLDLGALNCFHNTEASDCNRQPRADKIYNNLSMLLPPERMRYLFSTESSDLSTECDLFSRVCTTLGGRPLFGGISPLPVQDTNPILLAKIKALTEFYKTTLREIQRDADVFHHTPMLPIFKPSKYSAVEYAEKSRQKAYICVHDLNATVDARVLIYPRSVTPGASYRLTLLAREASWVQDGLSLQNQGILLTGNLSEIILLEKLPTSAAE